MKTYVLLFIAILCNFSFNCFAQYNDNVLAITEKRNSSFQFDTTSKEKEGLVITGYYVEETVNMAFGKRITKYEVSRLSMVSTYDLGPNNTRVVTPIYRKAKAKPLEVANLQSKALASNIDSAIQPVEVELAVKQERPKYVIVDVVSTYKNVLDRGYESIDMLMKVADRYYFNNDLVQAEKYYSQLFKLTSNLDIVYYYRYAQSLKAINETKKANQIMQVFENKSTVSKIVKK